MCPPQADHAQLFFQNGKKPATSARKKWFPNGELGPSGPGGQPGSPVGKPFLN
jgi:hypothetical protein